MKSMIFALLLAALSPAVWAADTQAMEVGLLAQREHAEQLRNEAGEIRHRAETAYVQEDAGCMRKILVNACRDSAREHYLKDIAQARKKEIEANRIDTEAKTGLNRLHESELKAKRANQASIHMNSPRSAPKPAASEAAAAASEPVRIAPPALSAEKTAKFEAQKQQRRQEADARHAKEAEQAKIRADKAKADAAKYEVRAREVAERKAKRAEQSSPAPHSLAR
ncbi:hypothetical protein [Uliginosibacterium gangwonense]|uniref:hypothetical protein n=1 Tax=Uliginosibacterium gangwonense TaxID=392736 RepID=UPI000379A4FE|nr:hypothetical protein [Uliginosibacterium gangwonense]